MAARSFSGLWDDDEGLVVRVEGAEEHGAPHVATMHMPDGGLLELRVASRGSCCFEVGGECYEGTLADDGNSISWSDGGTWIRQAGPPEPPPVAAGAAEAKAPPPGRGGRGSGAEGLLGASWAAGRGLLVSASFGRGGKGFGKGLGKGKGKAPLQGSERRAAKVLTLERAVSLQEELLDAFADEGFQGKLREVERLHGKAFEECTEAHKDLYLEVHREVLPAYGFPGTAQGVREMLAAAARHNADEDFWRNRLRLNRLLGLEPPPARRAEEPLSGDAPPAEATGTGAAAVGAASGARAQRPAGRVRVAARHATESEELQVMVPENATFQTVKEAISKKVGRGEFLTKGRLVGLQDEVFVPYKDENQIGDLREVLVLGFSLQTHDDEEAKAWRHELAQRHRAAGQR